MRLAVVVVVGSAACAADPTLRVDVVHPVGVSRTTISVYEPQSFVCEDVEFGDVSDAELAAAKVAEIEIVRDEMTGDLETTGDLHDLSRMALKVVVARGFDSNDALATGGCFDKGEIKGQDRITIETDRAALAAIGPLVLGGDDPFSLTVALTDTNGIALRQNRLSWRVYGPSGSTPAPAMNAVDPQTPAVSGVWHLRTPTCVTDQGVRTIHPVPPSTVGGFAVQIRPAWQIAPPPVVTGFTGLAPGLHATVPAPLRHPCAIRTTATDASIMCVEATNPGVLPLVGREYKVQVAGTGVTISLLGEHFVPPLTISLISVPRGNLRDVYAVTSGGFVVGVASPSVVFPVGTQVGLSAGTAAVDALLLPDCGTAAPPRILLHAVTATDKKIVVKDLAGQNLEREFHGVSVPLNQAITMRATGCLTEVDPRNVPFVRQSAVLDVPPRSGSGRQTTSAYFDCVLPDDKKDQCYVDLPVRGAGAGYLPGTTPRLAGANVDASGLVVSTWSVLLQLTPKLEYLRVEADRIPAASVPKHIVYGHLDGDLQYDAFWDISNLDQSESAFQITYGQLAGTIRLSGLSPLRPLDVQDFLVGDVTNDGKDDVVMIGTSNPTTAPVYGLLVLPSALPAALPNLNNVDPACP